MLLVLDLKSATELSICIPSVVGQSEKKIHGSHVLVKLFLSECFKKLFVQKHNC